jgi:hypothetical protein
VAKFHKKLACLILMLLLTKNSNWSAVHTEGLWK